MPNRCYYVYILANSFHRLYTGVTGNLRQRVREHKEKKHPDSFTGKYGIDHLVYFERFQLVQNAIEREKEIKSWLRVKKIALIVEHNPTWRDLSDEFGKAIDPFDESTMREQSSF